MQRSATQQSLLQKATRLSFGNHPKGSDAAFTELVSTVQQAGRIRRGATLEPWDGGITGSRVVLGGAACRRRVRADRQVVRSAGQRRARMATRGLDRKRGCVRRTYRV